MAMEITNNYSGYALQGMAGNSPANSAANSAKEKETKRAPETAGNTKAKSTADYANELAKLVPSAKFRIGNTFSTAKSGITLTVSPELLEKMQNDPEKEKEMKELIKGVESAVNMLDSLCKASGWTVVFKHGYIDENGQFRSVAYLRNDFGYKMSEKLREERRKNAEKLMEKQKEKAAKNKKELEEMMEKKLEEKRAAKAEGKSAHDKAEELLEEKIASSKDGMIYLYDTDLKTIIKGAKEDNAGKSNAKEPVQAGANLDLQV